MDRRKQNARSGQAMAEFLVGLVAVMLLIVGLQQIGIISRQGYAAVRNARHEMADRLVNPIMPGESMVDFAFADPTQPGLDGKRYTGDDRRFYGNDIFYQDNDGYLEKVHDPLLEGQLFKYDREVPHYDLEYSTVLDYSERSKMFHTSDQQMVDVTPFLNRVLGRDTILIGHDIKMPRLDRVKR